MQFIEINCDSKYFVVVRSLILRLYVPSSMKSNCFDSSRSSSSSSPRVPSIRLNSLINLNFDWRARRMRRSLSGPPCWARWRPLQSFIGVRTKR